MALPQDIDERYLSALERLDKDELRRCLTPDALIWHCSDGIELDVEESIAQAASVAAGTTRQAIVRRREVLSDGVLILMDVCGVGASGVPFELPVALVLQLRDGLISRVEEYFDSRGLQRASGRRPPLAPRTERPNAPRGPAG